MNKPFSPLNDHLVIKYSDLYKALEFLAAPEKLIHVEDTIESLRALTAQGSPKVAFTLVTAAAWLTDEQVGSSAD